MPTINDITSKQILDINNIWRQAAAREGFCAPPALGDLVGHKKFVIIKNRRPATNLLPFAQTNKDYIQPLPDYTTGTVTLPASIPLLFGSRTMTPGALVIAWYTDAEVTEADFNSLMQLARSGQISFPGLSTVILQGFLYKGVNYCLNGEEPLSAVKGGQVFSITDGAMRTYNGTSWNTEGMDSWEPYTFSTAPTKRIFNRIVELDNGEILVIGGCTNYASTALTATIPAGKTNAGQLGALCQRFDPVSGTFRNSCPMPSNNVGVTLGGRCAALVQKLPNGKVWAGGGQNFDINVGPFLTDPASVFKDFWIYDPVTDNWTAAADAPETISPMSQFCTLKDGRLLVAGFQSPSAQTWPGGANATSLTKQRFLSSLHSYIWDWKTDTWTQVGNLNQRHLFSQMAVLDSGKVMMIGGFSDFLVKGISAQPEMWDPDTGNWSFVEDMPAIGDEEKITSDSYDSLSIASITKGSSLAFGGQPAPVMVARINGLTPNQYYVGGTIDISGTTSVVSGNGTSFAKSGNIITFTDSAASFLTTASAGVPIVISGSTSLGNDGTFPIATVVSNTQVTWVNSGGVAEAFSGTYTLHANDGIYTIFTVLRDTAGDYTNVYYYNEAGVNQASSGGTCTINEVTPGIRRTPIIQALPGNKVLVAGGSKPPCIYEGGNGAVSLTSGTYTDLATNVARKSCVIYDANTDTWTRTGDLKIGRSSAKGFTLQDGRVIAIGGVTSNFCQSASCEIYSPLLGKWSDGALHDPVVDASKHLVLFQGVSGNPDSGASPSPGLAKSNMGTGNNAANMGALLLQNGSILTFMGVETFSLLGAKTISNHISVYKPGLPSLGHELKYIP